MYPFVVFINKCMQGLFYEKVSLISEIPHQHPCWYFKPIKFGHLLILLTSEETNFNPKKFKSRHFLSSIHISLYSPFSHSLSLSLPDLSAFSHPLRLAPPCASPAWVSHSRTSASRTAAPLFQTQLLLNITALPSFPVTPSPILASPRGYSSYFSLFFLFVFIFWVFIWSCFIFWLCGCIFI